MMRSAATGRQHTIEKKLAKIETTKTAKEVDVNDLDCFDLCILIKVGSGG